MLASLIIKGVEKSKIIDGESDDALRELRLWLIQWKGAISP
jgi:hypothetical protein